MLMSSRKPQELFFLASPLQCNFDRRLASFHLSRVGVLCGTRAEDPADHDSHEQDDRDENEVRRRHVREVHGRFFTICADRVFSSCSTLPSFRHISHT